MMNYLFLGGCALFIVAFPVTLVYALVLKSRQGAAEKKFEALLDRAGFSPVDTVPILKFAGQSPSGKIITAKKATRNGGDYYHYCRKGEYGHAGSRMQVLKREFIFPFERETEKPVVVALIHPKTPKAMKTVLAGLLEKTIGGKLSRLDVSDDLKNNGIEFVIGEGESNTVFDLVDKKTLDLLTSAPDRCIVTFGAVGKSAVILYEFKDRNVDPGEFWNYIQKLTRF